ncbi:MAG TPA: hypothetical protein EYO18_06545, partial [Candidatus Marinimicrobia bacterium]|nr:hypothetical protein [Candidatus Neomarinimicrobiota bacterium]
MPKLIVHLSGVWPKDFSLSTDDNIYAPASMDRKRTHERAMTIDVISSICEASLCRKYANLYSKYQSYDSTGMIFCFLNDFYSYSLRPCFLLMHSILKLATDFPDHKLTIVSAGTDCEILPMFGFQTTESMRGSQDLMGSLVAKRLKPFVDSKNGDFVYVKGDFLRINKIRKILIWFVNFVFFTLFIIKCLSLNLFIKKSKNTHDKLIICRNRHQSRFAKEVVDNVSDSAIFLIPQ